MGTEHQRTLILQLSGNYERASEASACAHRVPSVIFRKEFAFDRFDDCVNELDMNLLDAVTGLSRHYDGEISEAF